MHEICTQYLLSNVYLPPEVAMHIFTEGAHFLPSRDFSEWTYLWL